MSANVTAMQDASIGAAPALADSRAQGSVVLPTEDLRTCGASVVAPVGGVERAQAVLAALQGSKAAMPHRGDPGPREAALMMPRAPRPRRGATATREKVRVEHKRCPRCEKELWAEAFNLDASSSTGLASYCRGCLKEYRAEYAGSRSRTLTPGLKVCTKCLVPKRLGSFMRQCDSLDGHASRCKACIKALREIGRGR